MQKRSIILISLALILISITYDNQILNFIISFRTPILTTIMQKISLQITLLSIFLVYTIFLIKNKKISSAFYLWFLFFLNLLIVNFLKILIARPRPLLALSSLTQYSFPSMHAALIFTTFPFMTEKFPKFKYLFLFLAFLISFSRLYLAAHYLTDVTAGALLGYTLSLLILYLENKKWK